MMTVSGINDFSLRDITNPEPKRFRRQISGIINFAKFREEQFAQYSELTTQTVSLSNTQLQTTILLALNNCLVPHVLTCGPRTKFLRLATGWKRKMLNYEGSWMSSSKPPNQPDITMSTCKFCFTQSYAFFSAWFLFVAVV
jgi:hypothetical protein